MKLYKLINRNIRAPLLTGIVSLGLQLSSFNAIASPPSLPILTSLGGQNNYVLVSTNTDSKVIAASGSYAATGIYRMPKVVKLKYELLDEGKTLILWLPAPGLFESDASKSDMTYPEGVPFVNLSILFDQIELVVKPDFVKLLSSFDPNTRISYRNESAATSMTQVTASTFSLANFITSLRYTHSQNKNVYLTVMKTQPFTGAEVDQALQSFETRVHNVITEISKKEASFQFPAPKIWLLEDLSKSTTFYHVFDLIDRLLIPLTLKDENMITYLNGVDESDWKRDFLNQAMDTYFDTDVTNSAQASSCSTYKVRLRTGFRNRAFRKSFFAPVTDTLVLPFLPVTK